MIYQELSLAPHLTIAENITLGHEPRMFGFVRRNQARAMARAALERLGHGALSPDRPVGGSDLENASSSRSHALSPRTPGSW
jgi:ribose transport system ATP-binding protein